MIIGIYGYPDAGKTTFVEQLIGSLAKKGYSVSSVKHTPHEKTLDREGKETWRHWKAGSDPVVFASGIETSIIKHSETSADGIAKMVLREYDPDVLVFQGFNEGSFQKVAIGKVTPRKGTVLTNPTLPRLIKHIESEVAFERVLAELPGLDCMKCGLDCRGLAGEVVKGKKEAERVQGAVRSGCRHLRRRQESRGGQVCLEHRARDGPRHAAQPQRIRTREGSGDPAQGREGKFEKVKQGRPA